MEAVSRLQSMVLHADPVLDAASFNAVIDTCGKNGELMLAFVIFWRMLQLGFQPNVITFSSLINSCCNASLLNSAMVMFRQMPLFGVSPNQITYNILVHAFAKANRFQQAARILEEFHHRIADCMLHYFRKHCCKMHSAIIARIRLRISFV